MFRGVVWASGQEEVLGGGIKLRKERKDHFRPLGTDMLGRRRESRY